MTCFDACAYIGRWPGESLAFHDARDLITNMQRLHIDKALVTHTVAWQNSPSLGNQMVMEEIAGHPELEPCWVLTPGLLIDEAGGAVAVCEQMAHAGVRAVRFFPRDHVFPFTEWLAGDLLAELNRRRYLILIDLDQIFTQSGLYDYDPRSLEVLPWLCQRYPDLSILITKVGYRAFQILLPLLQKHPNLYLDLSFFATHQGVECVAKKLGASRLLFGTSQPLVDAGGAMLRLMGTNISTTQRQMIAGGNLEKLLSRVQISSDQPRRPALSRNLVGKYPSEDSENLIPPGIEITDAHVHMGPYHKFYIPENSPEDMLRVMDHLKIARSCVSSHLAISGDWITGNRQTADAVAAHPDRFIGYVVANPNEPDLINDELKRAFGEWGFRGIKLVPDTHAHPIHGEGYRRVFEFAEQHHCLVLVHTYHGSRYDDPQLFGPLAERYPQVPMLMVHSGALTAGFAGAIRLAQEHPNLFLDISGSFITGEWIRKMVAQVGADRVLFSSDQPFIDPRYSLGRLLFADLTAAELALVIGGNIRRLFDFPVAIG